jgi:restriction system protein
VSATEKYKKKKVSWYPLVIVTAYAVYAVYGNNPFPKDINRFAMYLAAITVAYLTVKIFLYLGYRARLCGASLHRIDKMNGVEFEQLLKAIYEKQGYHVEMTPATGDFGADLILTDKKEKIIVQAKRYQGSVGTAAVQQVVAAREYYDADRAAVVTNSVFTEPAKTLAKTCNVELIDRYRLGKRKM